MNEPFTILGSRPLRHADWLKIVSAQVDTLRYGAVEIIVHDSQVTQIEKTERLRLDKAATSTRPNRG
jgi:hypothetical protein